MSNNFGNFELLRINLIVFDGLTTWQLVLITFCRIRDLTNFFTFFLFRQFFLLASYISSFALSRIRLSNAPLLPDYVLFLSTKQFQYLKNLSHHSDSLVCTLKKISSNQFPVMNDSCSYSNIAMSQLFPTTNVHINQIRCTDRKIKPKMLTHYWWVSLQSQRICQKINYWWVTLQWKRKLRLNTCKTLVSTYHVRNLAPK